jgi:hypothetical protein
MSLFYLRVKNMSEDIGLDFSLLGKEHPVSKEEFKKLYIQEKNQKDVDYKKLLILMMVTPSENIDLDLLIRNPQVMLSILDILETQEEIDCYISLCEKIGSEERYSEKKYSEDRNGGISYFLPKDYRGIKEFFGAIFSAKTENKNFKRIVHDVAGKIHKKYLTYSLPYFKQDEDYLKKLEKFIGLVDHVEDLKEDFVNFYDVYCNNAIEGISAGIIGEFRPSNIADVGEILHKEKLINMEQYNKGKVYQAIFEGDIETITELNDVIEQLNDTEKFTVLKYAVKRNNSDVLGYLLSLKIIPENRYKLAEYAINLSRVDLYELVLNDIGYREFESLVLFQIKQKNPYALKYLIKVVGDSFLKREEVIKAMLQHPMMVQPSSLESARRIGHGSGYLEDLVKVGVDKNLLSKILSENDIKLSIMYSTLSTTVKSTPLIQLANLLPKSREMIEVFLASGKDLNINYIDHERPPQSALSIVINHFDYELAMKIINHNDFDQNTKLSDNDFVKLQTLLKENNKEDEINQLHKYNKKNEELLLSDHLKADDENAMHNRFANLLDKTVWSKDNIIDLIIKKPKSFYLEKMIDSGVSIEDIAACVKNHNSDSAGETNNLLLINLVLLLPKSQSLLVKFLEDDIKLAEYSFVDTDNIEKMFEILYQENNVDLGVNILKRFLELNKWNGKTTLAYLISRLPRSSILVESLLQTENININKKIETDSEESSETALSLLIKNKHLDLATKLLERDDVDASIPDDKPVQYLLDILNESDPKENFSLLDSLVNKGAKLDNDSTISKIINTPQIPCLIKLIETKVDIDRISECVKRKNYFPEKTNSMLFINLVKILPNSRDLIYKLLDTGISLEKCSYSDDDVKNMISSLYKADNVDVGIRVIQKYLELNKWDNHTLLTFLISKLPESRSLVESLLQNKEININEKIETDLERSSETALSLLIKNKHLDLATKLLERDDVDASLPDDKPVQYLLDIFSASDSEEYISLLDSLVEKGARLDNDGAMQIIVKNPKTPYLKKLIDSKVDIERIVECVKKNNLFSRKTNNLFLTNLVSILPDSRDLIYKLLDTDISFEKCSHLDADVKKMFSSLYDANDVDLGIMILQKYLELNNWGNHTPLTFLISELPASERFVENLIQSYDEISVNNTIPAELKGASETALSFLIKNGHNNLAIELLKRDDVDASIPDDKPLQYFLKNIDFKDCQKHKKLFDWLSRSKVKFDNDILCPSGKAETALSYFITNLPESRIFIESVLNSKIDLGSNEIVEGYLLSLIQKNEIELAIKLIDREAPRVIISKKDILEAIWKTDNVFLYDAIENKTDISELVVGEMSSESRALINDAKKNHPERINFLKNIFNEKSDSLFASVKKFEKAANHVHRKFYATPYNNGSSETRWGNKRTVVLLENGTLVIPKSKHLFGIEKAVEISSERPKNEEGEITTVTLDEISKEDNISKEKIGQVNISSLEKARNSKVSKVMHRFNHDITHALRTASCIKVLNDSYAQDLTDSDIEKLQLMMLFSVVGREDESGFNDKNIEAKKLYKSYRAVSAIEFLKYCLDNWEYYKDVFKTKKELYRKALIVELMGVQTVSNMEAKQKVLSILIKGYSDENFQLLKKTINTDFRYNNALHSYSDDELIKLFNPEACEIFSSDNDKYLNYMNLSHAIDLLRCYDPGNPTDILGKEAATCREILVFYEKAKYKANAAQITIEFYEQVSHVISTTALVCASVFKSHEKDFQKNKENIIRLEQYLKGKIGKQYSEILEDTPFGDGRTLSSIIDEMGFTGSLKSEFGYPNGYVDIRIIPRYIAILMLEKGNRQLNKEYFNYCHYKKREELGKGIADIDRNNIEHRNIPEDVRSIIKKIDSSPRPSISLYTGFQMLDDQTDEENKERIRKECKDGVAILKINSKITIEFSSQEISDKVLDSLMDLNVLSRKPEAMQDPDGTRVCRVQVTEMEYNNIQSYLKYRRVIIPVEHSLEDGLVNSDGKISVLGLIEDYSATVCNHNTNPSPGETMTGLEWYFDQLENPISNRPTRTLPETTDREVFYDQRNLAESEVKKAELKVKKIVKRKLVEPIPLERQESLQANPSETDYWLDTNTQLPRNVFNVRGQPKNTIYTKKNAQTLLNPNGKQVLFQFKDKADYQRYFPIGIISDVHKLHLHGERYIWKNNVVSNNKFWLSGANKSDVMNKNREGTMAVSLNELQNDMKKDNEEHKVSLWNEVLFGNSKVAVQALVCSGEHYPSNNKVPLSYKLNLIMQGKIIKDKYNVDVPLLILDNESGKIQLYTEAMMLDDILQAANALNAGTYPYAETRLICDEQHLLINFFSMLASVEPCKIERDKKNIKVDKESREYIEYSRNRDAGNKIILDQFFKDINLDQNKIKEGLKRFELIGSESRELAYLDETLKDDKKLTDENFKKLFVRCIALEQNQVLQSLLQKDMDFSKYIPDALDDAKKHYPEPRTLHQSNIIQMLELALLDEKEDEPILPPADLEDEENILLMGENIKLIFSQNNDDPSVGAKDVQNEGDVGKDKGKAGAVEKDMSEAEDVENQIGKKPKQI